jgi:hypothetical protein
MLWLACSIHTTTGALAAFVERPVSAIGFWATFHRFDELTAGRKFLQRHVCSSRC